MAFKHYEGTFATTYQLRNELVKEKCNAGWMLI